MSIRASNNDYHSHSLSSGFSQDTQEETTSEASAQDKSLLKLLGQVVPSLLHDSEGRLDLTKIQAKSFAEFRQFLVDQARLNDAKAFRNPYASLLEEPEFQSLLQRLYELSQGESSSNSSLDPQKARGLLLQLESRWISIDAGRFVGKHFDSEEGRQKLRDLLGNSRDFSKDVRVELAKEIARTGSAKKLSSDKEVEKVTDAVSLWNYFNWGVNEQDTQRASLGALAILESADLFEKTLRANEEAEAQDPSIVKLYQHEALEHALSLDQYQEYQGISQAKSESNHPVDQLQKGLAELWLLFANQKNWGANRYTQDNVWHVNSELGQALVLNKIPKLLERSKQIKTEQEFKAFNAEVRAFLRGSVFSDGVGEQGQSYRQILKDILEEVHDLALGHGIELILDGVPDEQKRAYTDLSQAVDKWSYAMEMGEKIRFPQQKEKTPQQSLIQALENTKQELWYNYKQHKAVSRLLSNVAKGFDAGDIQDIQEANELIDKTIQALIQSRDSAEIAAQLQGLYQALKKDQVLYRAFEAAEMDGTEQLLGLAQTCLEMVAIAAVTDGLGLAGEAANLGKTAKVLSKADQLATAAVNGFGRGVAMATTENLVAVTTKEVCPEQDTGLKWFKDALATGTAMGLSGGVSKLFVVKDAPKEGLIQETLHRYTTGGFKALKHFLSDAGLEAAEEIFDQQLRQALDGKTQPLSKEELQEILAITFAGGGTQQGMTQGRNMGAQVQKPWKLPTRQELHQGIRRMAASTAVVGMNGGLDLSPNAFTEEQSQSLRSALESLSKAEKRIRYSFEKIEQEPLELAKLAASLTKIGRIEDARVVLSRAHEAAQRQGSPYLEHLISCEVALMWVRLGMTTKAHESLSKAREFSENVQDPENCCNLQVKIAATWGQLGMTNEAQAILLMAEEAASKIEEPYQRVESQSEVALKWKELGLIEEARSLLSKAGGTAQKIASSRDRANFQIFVAYRWLEIGMFDEAKSLITKAEVSLKKMKNSSDLSHSLAEIAGVWGQMGMTSEARAILSEAEVLAGKIKKPKARSDAQAKVAFEWGRIGMLGEARTLFSQAEKSASAIKSPQDRSYWQGKTALLYGELGMGSEAEALLSQAAEAAVTIKAGSQRHQRQSEIAHGWASLGVLLKAPAFLAKGEEFAESIQASDHQAEAQHLVSLKWVELAMLLNAPIFLIKAKSLARRIKDSILRGLIEHNLAEKWATLAIVLIEQAGEKINSLGGWKSSRVQEMIQRLQQENPSHWIPVMASIRESREYLSASTPLQQILALQSQAAVAISPDEKKSIRKQAHGMPADSIQEFSLQTATLEGLNDPASSQILLERARGWEESGKDLSDPRFAQLVSRLVKTGNSKALNFCLRLLANPRFTHRDAQEAGHYRLWLLKKLSQAGLLEPELDAYVQKQRRARVDMDEWVQAIVGKLGLTPTLSIFYFFLEGKEQVPSRAIAKVLKQRAKFEKIRKTSSLMDFLAKDPQNAVLYHILYGGRTRFALIDRYMPDQFQRNIGIISDELGSVHPGTLTKFSEALTAVQKPQEAIIGRLQEGRWPLADTAYARSIRIDISSEAVLQGLNAQWDSAFSDDQLGAMIAASLAGNKISVVLGLGELPAAVEGLDREPYEKILKRLGDRGDIAAFRNRLETDFKNDLRNIYRAKKARDQIRALDQASAEEVLVQWIEAKIEKPLRASEEWKSHLKAVFEGTKELRLKGGQKAKNVTLRYLDKRADLIEFLRFADAAQCCFTSENDYSAEWIPRMWKDPLSFVFMIEDNEPEAQERQAIGFIFGSFGLKDEKPVVLLNGVYMQDKTNEAVASILKTLEEDFSKPIGATHQFVAATHGGQTHLDAAQLHATGGESAYVNEPTSVTRLRALTDEDGKPEQEIYDDIDVGVNTSLTTKRHVWWRYLGGS